MDVNRLRRGEKVAGIAGIALLIVLFLRWYSVGGAFGTNRDVSVGVNAWNSFGFLDFLLFLIALVAIAQAVLTATQGSPALPVAASVITTAAGGLGTLLVLYRIVNPPGPEVNPSYGAFLGLIAVAGVAVGGFLAMREEGMPGIKPPEPEVRQAPPAEGSAPPPPAPAPVAPSPEAAPAAAAAAPPPPAPTAPVPPPAAPEPLAPGPGQEPEPEQRGGPPGAA
jgi:hypothetical protein